MTTNLQPYSSFESNSSAPGATNGTATLDTTHAMQGTTAIKLVLTTTGSYAQLDFGYGSFAQASAAAITSYTISYWVYTTGVGVSAHVEGDWYTSGGAYQATLAGTSTALTQNAWTRVSASGTSPSTAAAVLNNPTISSTSPSGATCWFDAGQVESGMTATTWAPGPGDPSGLAAPTNLHSTAVTSSTIALAWNAVALAAGYEVAVLTVPGAPTIGTATAGVGSASVAFSPSASNGGSSILDYTATSSPGGFTSTGAASPLTVGGLAGGTSYRFTAKARNIAGQSPASGLSNAVTPTSGSAGTTGPYSGLPWWSGVMANPTEDAAFGAWRGRAVDIDTSYFPGNSWANWDDPAGSWFYGMHAAGWPKPVLISLPLLTDVDASSYDALINGDYDQHWINWGLNQVAAGRGNNPVRLGWEADGDWYAWGVGNNAHGTIDQYKAGYARAVTMLRQGNPNIIMDCTVGAWRHVDYWPGDAYVDVVGVDYYDEYGCTSDPNGPNGINIAVAFARAHGKKFGVGEWGVSQSVNGHGDDPPFVQTLWDVFQANKDVLAYETYFNGSGNWAIFNPDENPNSSALYHSLWGA
jgi:hypothetical protein